MRTVPAWGVSILFVILAFPGAFAAEPGGAGTDWRAEFEAVCSQTDASMSLADEELAGLIARCDKLAELIGAEPEVVRRTFLKRLQRCRDLFVFVLESRKVLPAAAQETSPEQASPSEAPAAPASPSSSP